MKLSIITINYNNKRGLKDTMESVLSQTWTSFEWIIIDGGSTDGSKELIEQINSPVLKFWCSEKDKGVYNAMNKGIEKATGEYCLFLNSGDYLCSKTILGEVFDKDIDADILVGFIYRPRKGKLVLDRGHCIEQLSATDLLTNSLPHQASFIRRKLFKEFGLYDETLKIVSDWKFFLQSIVFGNATVEALNLPISVYECNGISDNNPTLNFSERERVIHELFPPRIWADYNLLQSLADVYRYPFFRRLYGILYKLTSIWHNHQIKKL